jgi:hypothetical protein
MVGARIRQETRQRPWLCKTTDDVIKQLNNRQFDNYIFMCKVDIKDFYLQGDHTAISRDAAKLFGNSQKIDDLILNMLYNQYVRTDDTSIYRVACGSGMGQCCSGELADWHFIMRIEDELLCNIEQYGYQIQRRRLHHRERCWRLAEFLCNNACIG